MHHLYFNYNYGQFTTLWDRLGGSYRQPNDELFQRESKMSNAEWNRQCQEMESTLKNVEGFDDRTYVADEVTLHKKISWLNEIMMRELGSWVLCVYFSHIFFLPRRVDSVRAVNSIKRGVGLLEEMLGWTGEHSNKQKLHGRGKNNSNI